MNNDGSPDTADAREKIALALDALPKKIREAMVCFCDMKIEQIAAATGLTHADATRAAARACVGGKPESRADFLT